MMTHLATENSVLSSAAPEPGQLVEVRGRQWIVSDVDVSSVSPELPKQNLVKLGSIDENALGEEIEVLWEQEPGAHVIERAALPTLSAPDDPSKLKAFLDAVRWGAATNADRSYLQVPFHSGVSIEDYQLDPLVRAIDMERILPFARGGSHDSAASSPFWLPRMEHESQSLPLFPADSHTEVRSRR
jgi:hypothetical protein